MHKGSCLCGAVRFEVEGSLDHAPEACHCSQCRKQSGHVLAGINVLKKALSVNGSDQVSWYRSSEKVERGFCSVCGSTLFWQPLMEAYEHIAISMGAFDTPTGTRLAKHTFVGDKGDYYDINDGVPQSNRY